MKFQNCILINFVTVGQTDAHTHTDKPKAICLFNFSKAGVNYFLTSNPYMKFQNYILINFVTDRQTHTRTSQKQYAPSIFPNLGA